MSTPDSQTQLLIQSNKSDQMTVKSRDGEKIGHVYSFMIDKRSGRALYGILAIGGFLGMGKAYYPLPFQLLAYDATTDSYYVTIDRRVLEGGPSWANNAPLFDQAYADRVASYYSVPTEDLTVEARADT